MVQSEEGKYVKKNKVNEGSRKCKKNINGF